MRPYDRNFSPPAPIAQVVITHPVSGTGSGLLQGTLDTGADITVIPETLVSKLGLSAKAYLWARSYDGTFYRGNVLIGRNVLNRFLITLDGIKLRFKLE